MQIELTKRQKDLYAYLLKQNDEVTKDDVVNNVDGYFETDRTNKTHNILDDVKALNADTTIEKIIHFKKSKLKIASEEEAEKYGNHFYKCALIQLKNCYAIRRKIKRNEQGDLLKKDEFWDSFLKETLEDESKKKL